MDSTLSLWLPFLSLACFILLAVVPSIINGDIRPLLIPRAEIERLADDMMRRFPADPIAAANTEEIAAWMRSDMFLMGKYRRVRLEIMRRCGAKTRG